MVRIQFPNTDVREVLAFYSKLTGKKIVYDNTVQGTVNIMVSDPVTTEEAIKIIETNLQLNGFALVPDGATLIKVSGLAKNPRSTGVPVFTDPSALPPGDQLVTLLYKVQYADVKELAQGLTLYIQPLPPYAAVVALPQSNAVLITENAGVVRSLVKILVQLDVPSAEVVSEFIPLESADVKDVMTELQTIFTPTPGQAVQPVNNGRGGRNNNNNQEQPASIEFAGGQVSTEDSIVIGKIRLVPDVRTNRILVVTRPVNLPFLRKLIHEFDAATPFGTPARRELQYVSALDVLDSIANAIAAPGEKAVKTSSTTSSTTTTGQGGQTTGGASSNGSSGSQSGSFNFASQLNVPTVSPTLVSETVGSTKLIADPRDNAIIVVGNKSIQKKVMTLLDSIDVRAPQVMLNTVIGELTLTNDQQLGVDYLLNYHGGSLTGGSGSGLVSLPKGAGSVLGGSQFTGLPLVKTAGQAFGAGTGLTAAIGVANSLDVIVNALESTGHFHITNHPMVFTSNNKYAQIASGESIPIPSQSLTTAASVGTVASVQSNVEYQQVALQLEVLPIINSHGEISLDILQQLNSVIPGGNVNIGGNSVPTISTRYIRTNVTVPDKATVVLGGLITTTKSNSAGGVPFFGRIPVLGYLFKNTVKNNDRSELIVLIRPVVSWTAEQTIRNSDTQEHQMMIPPNVNSTIDQTLPPNRKARSR